MNPRDGHVAWVGRDLHVPVVAVADDDALVGSLLTRAEAHLPLLAVSDRINSSHLQSNRESLISGNAEICLPRGTGALARRVAVE